MKQFEISGRESGQRMDKFLCKLLPKASKGFVYKMLRKKNIVLNEKKATGAEILKEKDVLKLYLSDETFEKFSADLPVRAKPQRKAEKTPPLEIIYEDADTVIINKPAGLLSQKAKPTDDSANDRILAYLLAKGEIKEEELLTFRPSICNRLDRNTSGILIAGKTMKGLQQMSLALKQRSVKKFYTTIVWGDVKSPGHERAALRKDEKTNTVSIVAPGTDPKEKPIETAYAPIKHYGAATLLEVELLTGRSHQIRAHLAHLGYPIVGDEKYGDRQKNAALCRATGLKGQLLHAARLEFPDGLVLRSPLPQQFEKIESYFKK